MKELDRTTEAIVLMNERWRKLNANMRQCVPFRANMGQHCSLSAEKDRLSGTVMMAWIWHVRINAMVFVPRAQAPPEADANELLYNLQSKFDRSVYNLFSPKVIVAGLPRESFPTEACLCGHECYLWLRTKILPRLAQGLFLNERTW